MSAPVRRAAAQAGSVGLGGDLLRGPGAVAGQHGERLGRDPVLGGGVPGRVEAPCRAPQIFKDVNEVYDDVDLDAEAGGLGADQGFRPGSAADGHGIPASFSMGVPACGVYQA